MEKSGYQTVIDGKVFPIEDLTREELIQCLIFTMDKIDEIDIIQCELEEKIREWRNGDEL